MSKRFTDSEKWRKLWFRKLTPIHKCLWVYICDNCSLGGVWDVDFESASFFIDSNIDIEKAKLALKKQYQELNEGSKWFIKDFIFFQYGELKDNNNLHRAVISSMKNSGVYEGYMRGIFTPLVKVKVKEGVKVKVKGIGKGKEYSGFFTEFWLAYPKKTGKGDAFKSWEKIDPSVDLIKKIMFALNEQSKSIQWQKDNGQFIPNPSTWLNQERWEDEISKTSNILNESGMQAYTVGQEWAKKMEIEDAKQK